MESVESQIAEWRAYVASAPAVNGHDVDELEDHLRHQIAELTEAGLTPDEGFLVAVKRMGDARRPVPGVRTRAQRPTVEAARPGRRRRAGARGERLARGLRLCCGRGRRDPGRAPRCRLPRRGADLVRAEPQPVRAAVPRRVLRPPTAARRAGMGADGGAVRARGARGQPLPVGCGLGHRDARRPRSAGRTVVRGRLPVHGRHDPIARAAHGLRPLHGRVVHLLRADRARGRRAHGPDRGDPRAHGGRRRRDRRVGAALGSGRRRGRRRVARRVEAAGRREHGARCSRCSSRRCSR